MTATAARDRLRRSLERVGEEVTLRRYTAGVATDYDAIKARGKTYQPDELTGGMVQGERWLLLSGEDVEASGITLPLKKGDKVVLRGRELNIEHADDSTRRIAGVLIGIEIIAKGA